MVEMMKTRTERKVGRWTAAAAAVGLLASGAGAQVESVLKVEAGTGGFSGPTDDFGMDVDVLGDVDGDGVPDLIVADEDSLFLSEIAWILLMNADGSVKSERPSMNDGTAVSGIGDLDDDGVADAVVVAFNAVTILFLNSDATEKSRATITPSAFGASFADSAAALGDFDGDGVEDLVIGDRSDSSARGAVYLVFLNTDGTVKSSTKIGQGVGGFSSTLAVNQSFGIDVTAGDIDGDGTTDLLVGAGPNVGGVDGKVFAVLLNPDGSVKSDQEINDGVGGFVGPVTGTSGGADFGERVAFLGDVTGDGIADVAVGNRFATDAGSGGTAWILGLNSDGTVATEARYNGAEGMPAGSVPSTGSIAFSHGLAGGDFNGDGIGDLFVAAPQENSGVLYIAITENPNVSLVTMRNGTGFNPICTFALNEPRLGQDWNVGIVTGAHPTAVSTIVTGWTASLPGGVFISLGELLVAGDNFFATTVPAAGFVDTHVISVPNDPLLLGFPIYCQGIVVAPGSSFFTNGIDIVINR